MGRVMQKTIGLMSKSLHWLIAFLMISLIGLGWYMVQLEYFSPYYYSLPALHYSLGISLFFVVLYKVVWQLFKPLPSYDTHLKKYEIYAAKIVHFILFFAMLLMPVSGYIIITSGTNDLTFFGLFSVPSLFVISESVRDNAISFHTYFSYFLATMIILHIAAALKHKFFDKFKTTRDMWPK